MQIFLEPSIAVRIQKIADNAREGWANVAKKHKWLDKWEKEGKHVQVWVDPKTLNPIDSIYAREGATDDIIVFGRDEIF